MDVTTISCGQSTRDSVRDYRDEHEFPNYDAALSALLEEVDAEQ